MPSDDNDACQNEDWPAQRVVRVRCRGNCGIHTWIPPSENVIAAMPRVAVRNAGLRSQPENASPRSGVSFSESNWPRSGLQKQHGKRQQEARRGGNVKRKTPTIMRGQVAAEQVSRRRPHRNRQIKHAEDPPAYFFGNRSATKVGAMVTKVASPIPTSVCRTSNSV